MTGVMDIVLAVLKAIIVILNTIYLIMFYEILVRNYYDVKYEDMITSSIVTLIMLLGIFAVCMEHLGCIIISIAWNILYLIYIQLFDRPFQPDNIILLAVITIILISSAFAVSHHQNSRKRARISFKVWFSIIFHFFWNSTFLWLIKEKQVQEIVL